MIEAKKALLVRCDNKVDLQAVVLDAVLLDIIKAADEWEYEEAKQGRTQ